MLSRMKTYIIYAVVGGILWFIMAHHFIFYEKQFYTLKKAKLHLDYTFYSIQEKSPWAILEIDELREAGIGEILVEIGYIEEDERLKIEETIEDEQ